MDQISLIFAQLSNQNKNFLEINFGLLVRAYSQIF